MHLVSAVRAEAKHVTSFLLLLQGYKGFSDKFKPILCSLIPTVTL